jgi:hypothetical protein
MFRYILIGFALYFLYRFVFELVIPIYKTTKQVKRQFDSVKQQRAEGNPKQKFTEKQKEQKPSINQDDYIEFEEL